MRVREADPTARRILDAALAQFAETGLRRTTMEDVARRAGLTRVTIYRRFFSKNALIEAVMNRELESFLAAFAAALDSVTELREQVVEGFVFTLRYTRDQGLVGRLLEIEPETILPYLTVGGGPYLAMARSFVADHLRTASDAPALAEGEADAVAETMIRLVLSFVLNPDSCIQVNDSDQLRQYARRHLAPILDN